MKADQSSVSSFLHVRMDEQADGKTQTQTV